MSQRKRKQINIEEKSRIITKLVSGIPNKDLAKAYGVSHSTISNIWREREKIQTLYNSNFLEMKRARFTKHTKIEEALLKWYKYQRTKNVPINGPILQQKANYFAKRFGEDFICSSSWVQRFRARHGFVGKMRGNVEQEAKQENDKQKDSEEKFTVPTLNDGLNAVSVLRKIVLFNEHLHMKRNYDKTLIKIQRELQNVYAQQKCSKQTKIIDFMKTEK